MSHINKKRPNTRMEIVRLAAHLFIVEGYTKTSLSGIAKTLDLSTRNITFYFPTKDHLLAALVDEMFDFQNLIMEQEAAEGRTVTVAMQDSYGDGWNGNAIAVYEEDTLLGNATVTSGQER